MKDSDTSFSDSIAANYQRWMVPFFFQPYAEHCAELARGWRPQRILEVGAGTGALTRELARVLPDSQILATDLNPAMAAVGRSLDPAGSNVRWEVADVVMLPAAAESIDLVVAQFAVMFFPDRLAAFEQMRRVLVDQGRLLITTWGPMEGNAMDLVVETALSELYPADPPSFMRRVPHGYHRPDRIREDLIASGFRTPVVDALEFSVPITDVRDLALALCTGTPIRTEILSRDPDGMATVVDVVTEAIQNHFGSRPAVNEISALVVTAQR